MSVINSPAIWTPEIALKYHEFMMLFTASLDSFCEFSSELNEHLSNGIPVETQNETFVAALIGSQLMLLLQKYQDALADVAAIGVTRMSEDLALSGDVAFREKFSNSDDLETWKQTVLARLLDGINLSNETE
jgi:hypothetical protein